MTITVIVEAYVISVGEFNSDETLEKGSSIIRQHHTTASLPTASPLATVRISPCQLAIDAHQMPTAPSVQRAISAQKLHPQTPLAPLEQTCSYPHTSHLSSQPSSKQPSFLSTLSPSSWARYSPTCRRTSITPSTRRVSSPSRHTSHRRILHTRRTSSTSISSKSAGSGPVSPSSSSSSPTRPSVAPSLRRSRRDVSKPPSAG